MTKPRRHLSAAPPTEHVAVDVFAARLSEQALHCRELGHTWRPFTCSWEPESRTFHRRMRCKCRTERVQVLNQHGGIVSNHYVYPEGYLAVGVDSPITGRRDAYRLEAVIRSLDDAAVKAVRRAVG